MRIILIIDPDDAPCQTPWRFYGLAFVSLTKAAEA
jgi:hypothetical protein